MWSVLTMPYLVLTVVPSTSGSRSRCTPWRDTSAPPAFAARGHLVDLVDEDDAVAARHWPAPRLLISSSLTSLAASSSTSSFSASPIFSLRVLRLPPPTLREQALELLGHLLHAGRAHDLERGLRARRPRSRSPCRRAAPSRRRLRITWRAVLSGLAGAGRTRRGGGTRMSSTRSSAASSARARCRRICALALLLDGHFDQVADDGVDVLADVADLGELGRLDLDEGRVGQPRQAARDLGLAHAGGPDHQDVLRRDLAAQRLGPPAGGASGCAARSPPRAWRPAGRRCGGRVRRRSPAASSIAFIRASRWCGSGWCRCRGRRRSRATS